MQKKEMEDGNDATFCVFSLPLNSSFLKK